MKAHYCQVFGERVKVKVGEYPFVITDFLVSWELHNGKPVIQIHPDALTAENNTLLLVGLHHDLFEIACWLRGIYDSETEGFLGFGHEFYVEAHGKTLIAALNLYRKLSPVGKRKAHLTVVKG